MKKIFELKEKIKTLAAEQKTIRPQRKESFEGTRTHRKPHAWETPAMAAQAQHCSNKRHLREMHIAYCLLRGTPMEMIEPKHNKFKPSADTDIINSLIREYADAPAEAVCSDKV